MRTKLISNKSKARNDSNSRSISPTSSISRRASANLSNKNLHADSPANYHKKFTIENQTPSIKEEADSVSFGKSFHLIK